MGHLYIMPVNLKRIQHQNKTTICANSQLSIDPAGEEYSIRNKHAYTKTRFGTSMEYIPLQKAYTEWGLHLL